jgi:acyl-CoA synthetase (NDP forming)
MSDRLAQDLVDVAETTDKPVCVIWGSPVGLEPAYRDILLGSSKVAVFRTFGNCVTALRAYFDWHDFLGRPQVPPEVASAGAGAAVAGSFTPAPAPADATSLTSLSEWDAKQLVRSYGVATPREELVSSRDDAVAAAGRIGYPVVLKACGAHLLHKTELGLVRLGVPDAESVRTAYDELVARAPGEVQGVLVGELVTGGVEAIVGVARDALFGPVVMVGLGGVFVEVLKDVAFGVPPFDHGHAERMVRGLRGFPLLQGVRGTSPADVDALIDVVMSVQQLVLDHGDAIGEVDLNPVVVLPHGAVALDALITR